MQGRFCIFHICHAFFRSCVFQRPPRLLTVFIFNLHLHLIYILYLILILVVLCAKRNQRPSLAGASRGNGVNKLLYIYCIVLVLYPHGPTALLVTERRDADLPYSRIRLSLMTFLFG